MTILSNFLPQGPIARPCVAKLSASGIVAIPFQAHGKAQFLKGSNGSARLAHPKLQVARAAAICIAQVEEAAQDTPSQSLNGAGLHLDRPISSERVRQDATDDASASTAQAGAVPEVAHERMHEQSDRRENYGGRGRDSRGRGRGSRGGGDGRREPRESRASRYEDARRAPCTEHNLKIGDTVLGRVVRSQGKGSNIELVDDPRIIGFSLAVDGPYLMRDRVGYNQTNMLLPNGLVREFLVKAIPENMEYYGKGPLLTAKELDIAVAWERARQMKHACEEDKEIFTVVVTDVNSGGLLATMESLPAFLPYSLMAKNREDSWMSIEDVKKKYLNKTIEVGIKDVSPQLRKVVLNMQQAITNRLLKKLTVGSLVWGTVRRVEPYGVFVGLEDTRFSGLLHISSISRAHIESVEDMFSVGDRVRAMLIGMDEGFSRISLSTSELEAAPGDMLFSKEKVYAEADVQATEALKRLQQRDEDERFYGNDKAPSARQQGGDSFDFDGDYKG